MVSGSGTRGGEHAPYHPLRQVQAFAEDLDRGKAQVCVDPGTAVQSCTTIDLFSSVAQLRSVVFSKAVNPATSHKVEVRVLGQKSASSTGTRVDVDAFTTTT